MTGWMAGWIERRINKWTDGQTDDWTADVTDQKKNIQIIHKTHVTWTSEADAKLCEHTLYGPSMLANKPILV